MYRIVACLLTLALANAPQTSPPPTDVYLATLHSKGGGIAISQPVNISKNAGYDNQPSFTADGRSVLFTSVRGNRKPDPANSAATGSDIYRFDIESTTLTQITSTPESEYSPTMTPDGRYFSVIRVEGDGTQRLWRFDVDGRDPQLLLADVKPVGYHAWIDDRRVALFVLGSPATLQVASVETGRAEIIAKDIGRSLQRIPGGGISFVQRGGAESKGASTVMRLEPATGRVSPLVRVPDGVQNADVAWTPDGSLLLAHGGKLLRWRQGEKAFLATADLSALGLRDVSRMAISPNGDRIALVASQ